MSESDDETSRAVAGLFEAYPEMELTRHDGPFPKPGDSFDELPYREQQRIRCAEEARRRADELAAQMRRSDELVEEARRAFVEKIREERRVLLEEKMKRDEAERLKKERESVEKQRKAAELQTLATQTEGPLIVRLKLVQEEQQRKAIVSEASESEECSSCSSDSDVLGGRPFVVVTTTAKKKKSPLRTRNTPSVHSVAASDSEDDDVDDDVRMKPRRPLPGPLPKASAAYNALLTDHDGNERRATDAEVEHLAKLIISQSVAAKTEDVEKKASPKPFNVLDDLAMSDTDEEEEKEEKKVEVKAKAPRKKATSRAPRARKAQSQTAVDDLLKAFIRETTPPETAAKKEQPVTPSLAPPAPTAPTDAPVDSSSKKQQPSAAIRALRAQFDPRVAAMAVPRNFSRRPEVSLKRKSMTEHLKENLPKMTKQSTD